MRSLTFLLICLALVSVASSQTNTDKITLADTVLLGKIKVNTPTMLYMKMLDKTWVGVDKAKIVSYRSHLWDNMGEKQSGHLYSMPVKIQHPDDYIDRATGKFTAAVAIIGILAATYQNNPDWVRQTSLFTVTALSGYFIIDGASDLNRRRKIKAAFVF